MPKHKEKYTKLMEDIIHRDIVVQNFCANYYKYLTNFQAKISKKQHTVSDAINNDILMDEFQGEFQLLEDLEINQKSAKKIDRFKEESKEKELGNANIRKEYKGNGLKNMAYKLAQNVIFYHGIFYNTYTNIKKWNEFG